MKARLTIYDLDRTLTARPTFTPFLAYASLRLAPWRLVLLPVWIMLMIGYRLGLYSRTVLKRRGMRLMLGRPGDTRLARVGASFARSRALHPGAQRALAADRAEGRAQAIATAAFAIYARPLGQCVGIDDVIGTLWDAGSIPGGNCYGAVKLARVEEWLGASGIERAALHVRAVSDSFADAPLLDWADEAWFVTADPRQARKAARRGWTPVDFSR
ncbi:MAG: haloacid dehalogenase-like hydrolase [Tsuneonella sp.]